MKHSNKMRRDIFDLREKIQDDLNEIMDKYVGPDPENEGLSDFVVASLEHAIEVARFFWGDDAALKVLKTFEEAVQEDIRGRAS